MTSERPGNRLVLLGWPVAHSRSPAMHEAAFRALDLSGWSYEAVAVPPEDLASAWTQMRREGVIGGNVTYPHKQAFCHLVDRLDGEAKAIGAVNTAVLQGDDIKGYNTDVDGFIRPLRRRGIELADSLVIVVGGGGAARAVIAGCFRGGAREVDVAVRDPAAAGELIEELAAYPSGSLQPTRLRAIPIDAALEERIAEARMVVNATPVGLGDSEASPIPAEWIARAEAFFDCVYRGDGQETPLVAAARRAGVETFDGLEMLLHQGVRAFELWTGVEAPVEVMAEAIRTRAGEKAHGGR